jgi:transposase
VPTYGHHEKVTLFGTVDAKTGKVICVPAKACNARTFLTFLRHVLDQYPDQQVIMVLDNSKIHHANLLQPFLQKNQERLFLLFLPPYSPKLNPIEKLWGWLKKTVIYNGFHKNEAAIESAVWTFLSFIENAGEQVPCRVGLHHR